MTAEVSQFMYKIDFRSLKREQSLYLVSVRACSIAQIGSVCRAACK